MLFSVGGSSLKAGPQACSAGLAEMGVSCHRKGSTGEPSVSTYSRSASKETTCYREGGLREPLWRNGSIRLALQEW